jgi:PAS domain-containing protein
MLQVLLDSREDAICLLDADGRVLAANRAACALLGAEISTGHPLSEHLADTDREQLTLALEGMEDSAVQSLDIQSVGGTPLTVRLSQWERGDGLIVLGLSSRTEAAGSIALTPVLSSETHQSQQASMLSVVETWERNSGSSRLELAEKSRIWRVTIDDGRLRTRAMERYLTLSKLPHNPRWRDVLRSAYYVLGQCPMESSSREALQQRVNAVLAYTRRNALV